MAVKYFCQPVHKLQLVIVYAVAPPCVDAAGTDTRIVIFKIPRESVTPRFLHDQASGIFIEHRITHRITLPYHISFGIVRGKYDFLIRIFGMRSPYFHDASVADIVFHPQMAPCTVRYIAQVALGTVTEPYGKAVSIGHAFKQMYGVILFPCKTIVQILVHIPDTITVLLFPCFFPFGTYK